MFNAQDETANWNKKINIWEEYDKLLWGIEDWEEDKKLNVKEWFKKFTHMWG